MGRRRTGTAVRRRGRWYARVTLHRAAPLPSGAFKRHEEPVVRPDAKPITEAFARDFARRLQARYDEGRWEPLARVAAPRVVERPTEAPPPSDQVQGYVMAWLERQTYDEASKDKARVKAWLPRTAFAKLPVRQVTPQRAAAWLLELAGLPNARGKPAAPRTIRNVVDPVHRALKFAVFEGLLAGDPFAVIPSELRPQSVDADPAKRRGRRLYKPQLQALLGCEEAPVDRRVLYALLVLSGERLGEAVAVRWCDLMDDEPLARLTVAEQWRQREKRRAPTKTDVVRSVPVHPELARILRWWRGRWPEWYGRDPKPDDLVIPARAHRLVASVGGSRRQGAVYRDLQTDLRRAGLPRHRVHDFRHTFASLCVDAGMEATVAQRWTHAPPSTSSAVEIYREPSWVRQCEEMLKLTITFALGRE